MPPSLTPVLAFRRASGACVDARTFLDGVKEGPLRETKILHITPFGRHRALVECVVTMDGAAYHNLQLFVRRDPEGADWELLAWANEPA